MTSDTEKTPIDLAEICGKLWMHRKQYIKVLPVVLIGTYLITLFIPRVYKCEVSLAPETSGTSGSGSINSLASSFGLGSLAKMAGSKDAINVEIYPNLFKSNDFALKLMNVDVVTKDSTVKCNYYTYIRDKQGSAPWRKLIGYVSELLKPTPPDTFTGKEKISTFKLTKQQSGIFDAVKSNLKCVIDKKTDVVTITVKDQDPLVAGIIADATCKKLQEFIIEYRTNKTRIDYEYYKKLCANAKNEYDEVRRSYGAYSDANEDVILSSYKMKAEDMENEMQLKYNVYSTLNTQMQIAQFKLQEATPAFTILKSASVPVKPAGPKRTLISLVMTILAGIILSARILLKKEYK